MSVPPTIGLPLCAGHMHALVDPQDAAFGERLRDFAEIAHALLPVAEQLHPDGAAAGNVNGGRAAVERVIRLVRDALAQ